MPCCAFVACLIGQLLVAVGAVRRLLGLAREDEGERNAAVEWRLGVPAVVPLSVPRTGWFRDPRARRGLAVAAAFEILLILGAVWGYREHFGGTDRDHAHHHAHASVEKEIHP